VTGERDKNTGMASVYAAAVAEGLDPSLATPVRQAVFDAVHEKLVQIATAAAPDIYQRISAEWNDLAAEFSGHAKVTDLEQASDTAHHLAEGERQAWLRGEQAAHRLDLLLPVLRAAGELAGLPLDDPQTNLPDEGALVALCCQIDGSTHRRRLWEGWQHRGRCGRWAALLALGGVTIKAAGAAVDAFKPYAPPRPFEVIRRQMPGAPMGTYETINHDPEDGPPPAEPFDPRRPSKRAVIA
jgi:hypothetical protein